jgi:hypothetical protein
MAAGICWEGRAAGVATKILTFEPTVYNPSGSPSCMSIETTDRHCVPTINREDLAVDMAGFALGSDLQVGDWICECPGGAIHQIASIDDEPSAPDPE